MPKRSKSDDLKNRLDEIFSSTMPASAEQAGLEQPAVSGQGEPQPSTTSEIGVLFSRAFESVAIGACITGLDGKFIFVNPAFARMLGYAGVELVGQNFQALTYTEDLSIGAEAMHTMLSGESPTAHIQKRYLHKDGHLVWVDLNLSLVRDDNGRPLHFVALGQDINEQKHTAELLERRVRELHFLNDIGHKIDELQSQGEAQRNSMPLADFFAWVTERIPEAMQYSQDCVAAIEYDGKVYGVAETLDLPSKVVGGLRIGGELVGWLHIAYRQPRTFVDADSALVGGIVSRLIGYIQSRRQQEEADRRSTELAILNDLALALASALDLRSILQIVYEHAARLTDVTNFYIALYDEAEKVVSFPVAYSEGMPTEINSRPLGNSLTDYIIRSGQPLLLTDRVTDRIQEMGIQISLYGRAVPAESWLGVPIVFGEHILGVVAVQSITTPGLFKGHDRDVLTNVARSAANALAIYRQYGHLQVSNRVVEDSPAVLFRWRAGVEALIEFVTSNIRQFGYEPEELMHGRMPYPIYDEDAERVSREAAQYVADGLDRYIQEYRIVTKDGQVRWTRDYTVVERDAQGAPMYFEALVIDITDTKYSEQELEKSERRMSDIIDFLPDAILVVDNDGKVIAWNRAMEELSGVKAANILGKGNYEHALAFYQERRPMLVDLVLLPQEEFENKYARIQRVGEVLLAQTELITLHLPDGTERSVYVAGRAIPLRDASGQIIGAIELIQNVTEQQKMEQANLRRATEMATVAQVSTAVATVLDPRELLQSVVDLTKQSFGLYHVHIYVLNEKGDRLVLTAGSGEVGRQMVEQGWEIPLDREQSLVARTARSRKGVIVNDVRTDADFMPNELLTDTAAEMAVPLISGDEVLGVLDVQSDEAGHFTESDMVTQTTLAYQVAVALQNARLYERTQQALTEAEALYAGSSLISGANNMERILQGLIASTALKKLERANILLFNRPWIDTMPEALTVAAVWEKSGQPSQAPAGTTYPFARFPGLTFLDRDKPFFIGDIYTDERIDENLRATFASLGMRSVVTCPLRSGNEWFGIISGQSSSTFSLTTEEVRRINNLMDQAATVAQGLRLFEQTRANENLVRSIIEATPDWIFVKDRDHRYKLVNKGYADLMGRPPEDFINRNDLEIGFAADRVLGDAEKGMRGYWDDDQAVMVSGERVFIPSQLATVHGETRFVSTLKVPLRDENGAVWGILGFVRDITERERLLQDAEQQAARLAVLNELGTRLNTASDEAEIFKIVGSYTSRILSEDASRAAIVRLNLDERSMEITELGNDRNNAMKGRRLSVESTLMGRVIRERRMITLPEDGQLMDYADTQFWAREGMLVVMSAPLIVGGQIIGMIMVASKARTIFAQAERSLLNQVVALVNSALLSRRLLSEAEQRARQEHLLREITTRVRGSMDPDLILRTAVRELGATLGRKAFVQLGLPGQPALETDSSTDGVDKEQTE